MGRRTMRGFWLSLRRSSDFSFLFVSRARYVRWGGCNLYAVIDRDGIWVAKTLRIVNANGKASLGSSRIICANIMPVQLVSGTILILLCHDVSVPQNRYDQPRSPVHKTYLLSTSNLIHLPGPAVSRSPFLQQTYNRNLHTSDAGKAGGGQSPGTGPMSPLPPATIRTTPERNPPTLILWGRAPAKTGLLTTCVGV